MDQNTLLACGAWGQAVKTRRGRAVVPGGTLPLSLPFPALIKEFMVGPVWMQLFARLCALMMRVALFCYRHVIGSVVKQRVAMVLLSPSLRVTALSLQTWQRRWTQGKSPRSRIPSDALNVSLPGSCAACA